MIILNVVSVWKQVRVSIAMLGRENIFRSFKNNILLILAFCSVSALGLAHEGATGIVKERMDNYSRNQENLKAIYSHLKQDDLNAIAPLAKEIRDWAKAMPEYFPEGTDGAPSEASPKIWNDFDGFKLAAKANAEAADSLYNSALEGNKADVLEALKRTAASCAGCHKVYRLK
jgi:cytochrome c556